MRGAVQMQSARTGGRDDFNTPPVVVGAVAAIAQISLDPCWNPSALTGAEEVFDGGGRGDGLTAKWGAYVRRGQVAFVNFPYSAATTWADKVIAEADDGVPIIVLCAARTDTKWWHRLWSHAESAAFWRRRIKFWLDGAPAKSGATFPSALMSFNVTPRRFRSALEPYAAVVTP